MQLSWCSGACLKGAITGQGAVTAHQTRQAAADPPRRQRNWPCAGPRWNRWLEELGVLQVLFQAKGFQTTNPLTQNPCPNAQVTVRLPRRPFASKDEACDVGGGVCRLYNHCTPQAASNSSPPHQRHASRQPQSARSEADIYEKAVGPSATLRGQTTRWLASGQKAEVWINSHQKSQNRPLALTISEVQPE